jgi:hypothetical protein
MLVAFQTDVAGNVSNGSTALNVTIRHDSADGDGRYYGDRLGQRHLASDFITNDQRR